MADQNNTDDTKGGMSGLLAERMAEGGGALCNDQNGLCLGSQGDIDITNSGVYSSISKLASLLDSTVDGSGSSSGNNGNIQKEVPLVSIHTDKAALLVKEYGGRTVVFRVPNDKSEETIGESNANKEETGGIRDDAEKTS